MIIGLLFINFISLTWSSTYFQIQAYYKFRLHHKDYCQDLYPSAVRLAFDHSIVSVLSPRDQHGRRIMFIESGGNLLSNFIRYIV